MGITGNIGIGGDTLQVAIVNWSDALSKGLANGAESGVSTANASYSMDNLVWWILAIAGGLAALAYIIAAVCYACGETTFPSRLLKLGTAFMLMSIGLCADSTLCWGLVAILIFALLLKKSTVIDIVTCLFNDTKDPKVKP